MHNAYTNDQLAKMIDDVASAERITKTALAKLSRELLIKWDADHDPSLINLLLGKKGDKFVLTPMNWRTATQYFHEMVGAVSNFDKQVKEYARQGKGKRVPMVFADKASKNSQKRTKSIRENWLANEDNNIWVWSTQIQLEKAPVNYAGDITKSIQKAMAEDKGNMEISQVLDAVMAAGIKAEDLFAMLNNEA
jgi:hypothetical protein